MKLYSSASSSYTCPTSLSLSLSPFQARNRHTQLKTASALKDASVDNFRHTSLHCIALRPKGPSRHSASFGGIFSVITGKFWELRPKVWVLYHFPTCIPKVFSVNFCDFLLFLFGYDSLGCHTKFSPDRGRLLLKYMAFSLMTSCSTRLIWIFSS